MTDEFFIRSKLNGYVIDIRGADPGDGAELIAWPKKDSDNENQRWTRVDASDGSFYLRSALGGKVIDIYGGDTSPGARLITWSRNEPPSDNQRWVLTPTGNGDFYITSKLNGFVIDICGCDSTPGAALIAYPTNDPPSANQLWTIEAAVPVRPPVRISEWEDNLDNWFTRSQHNDPPWIVRGPVMIVELRGTWTLNLHSAGQRTVGPMSGRLYVPDRCSLDGGPSKDADTLCTGFKLALKNSNGDDAGPSWS